MSAKKKWQHFVPRHYLKRFSFDGGRRIRLVRVRDGYYVSDGALAGQCAKNYFYSRDPKVEDHLAEIEGHSEAQIRKICEERMDADDKSRSNDTLLLPVCNARQNGTSRRSGLGGYRSTPKGAVSRLS
jgi:hypothetical protein